MTEAAVLPDSLPAGSETFAAPWEARAFAIAVSLNRTGHFAWGVFAAALGEELRQSGAQAAYYRCWLTALERVSAEQGLAPPQSVTEIVRQLATATADHADHHHDDHDDEAHSARLKGLARPIAIAPAIDP